MNFHLSFFSGPEEGQKVTLALVNEKDPALPVRRAGASLHAVLEIVDFFEVPNFRRL